MKPSSSRSAARPTSFANHASRSTSAEPILFIGSSAHILDTTDAHPPTNRAFRSPRLYSPSPTSPPPTLAQHASPSSGGFPANSWTIAPREKTSAEPVGSAATAPYPPVVTPSTSSGATYPAGGTSGRGPVTYASLSEEPYPTAGVAAPDGPR